MPANIQDQLWKVSVRVNEMTSSVCDLSNQAQYFRTLVLWQTHFLELKNDRSGTQTSPNRIRAIVQISSNRAVSDACTSFNRNKDSAWNGSYIPVAFPLIPSNMTPNPITDSRETDDTWTQHVSPLSLPALVKPRHSNVPRRFGTVKNKWWEKKHWSCGTKCTQPWLVAHLPTAPHSASAGLMSFHQPIKYRYFSL